MKCKWRKRLNLPYRVEYECKKGKELIGDKGIMALRDKDGLTWKVSKRHYVKQVGQVHKTIKKDLSKEQAVKFVKKYIK